jgi:hypothetical protein
MFLENDAQPVDVDEIVREQAEIRIGTETALAA